MSRNTAECWQGFAERVRDLIPSAAPVKHLEETGFRIAGRTQWLHAICTPWLTFQRTSPRRGDLLAGVTGCLVQDHWKPYFTLQSVLHGMCNVHHLRELQALVVSEKEAWARRMQQLLRRASRAVRLARDWGIPLPRSLAGLIERLYDRLLAQALAYREAQPPLRAPQPGRRGRKKRRVGHYPAVRLRDRKNKRASLP